MATGFISKPSAGLCTYFMKALHHQLPVVVWKQLYSRCYSSVLCLFCSEIEFFDHVFSCVIDLSTHHQLLETHAAFWKLISSLFCYSSCPFLKIFVFDNWFQEAVSVFHNPKLIGRRIVEFVHAFNLSFKDGIWLVCAKHQALMEKNGLIPSDGLISASISGLSSGLFTGVIRLLRIVDAFSVRFGFRRSCSFFFGIGNDVSVHIAV
ncbi:hypothetical protein G9A89_020606 [Geosiphon pyriformis]|nr:hypothetical protein G9A89_020606 [Geosiphon pyriformis]